MDNAIPRTRVVTASATTELWDDVIECNHTAAITITLSSIALAKGKRQEVKDVSGNAVTNNITVSRQGSSENIDGAASYIIDVNRGAAIFTPNATRTEWNVS